MLPTILASRLGECLSGLEAVGCDRVFSPYGLLEEEEEEDMCEMLMHSAVQYGSGIRSRALCLLRTDVLA